MLPVLIEHDPGQTLPIPKVSISSFFHAPVHVNFHPMTGRAIAGSGNQDSTPKPTPVNVVPKTGLPLAGAHMAGAALVAVGIKQPEGSVAASHIYGGLPNIIPAQAGNTVSRLATKWVMLGAIVIVGLLLFMAKGR